MRNLVNNMYTQSLLIKFMNKFDKPIWLINLFLFCFLLFSVWNFITKGKYNLDIICGSLFLFFLVNYRKHDKLTQLKDIWGIFILLRCLFAGIALILFMLDLGLNKLNYDFILIFLAVVPFFEFYVKNDNLQTKLTVLRFTILCYATYLFIVRIT